MAAFTSFPFTLPAPFILMPSNEITAESGTCALLRFHAFRVSSSSPSTSPELILHLCVLQALDTFSHSSPSLGRQRAFQPGGHNAAIPANQWQINQCYLFFPCLCCDRFPPPHLPLPAVTLPFCRDLNFAQLSRAHFRRQIVIARGLPSSESDASVGAG